MTDYNSDWVGDRSMLKASEILQHALDVLGPNGENWAQGDGIHQPGKTCMMLATHTEEGPGYYWPIARGLLYRAIGLEFKAGSGVEWNDAPTTTWPMVKEALIKARDHALMVGA